jgi:hypothetical protein
VKNKLLLLFLFPFLLSAQPPEQVETVRISKNQSFVYKGINQEVRDWFVYVDESGVFYLVNLQLPDVEVEAWCRLRKNSQNIYKGKVNEGAYKTLVLEKENDPGQTLRFYLKTHDSKTLELVSMDDSTPYSFKSIK